MLQRCHECTPNPPAPSPHSRQATRRHQATRQGRHHAPPRPRPRGTAPGHRRCGEQVVDQLCRDCLAARPRPPGGGRARHHHARRAGRVDQPQPRGRPRDIPLPAGARLFDAREAARLNQSRGFLLRLDVLARLPMTRAWCPEIDHPTQGLIVIAPPGLQSELTRLAVNLARRRRELLVVRGP
jgi:hypothetical protein